MPPLVEGLLRDDGKLFEQDAQLSRALAYRPGRAERELVLRSQRELPRDGGLQLADLLERVLDNELPVEHLGLLIRRDSSARSS